MSSYALFGNTPKAHFEALSIAAIAVLIGTLHWQVGRLMYSLWSERRRFEGLSRHDSLTNLLNRRAFDDSLNRLFSIARRERKSIAVAMVDIDHFKRYNDQYGHLPGDEALKQVARVLESVARRPTDLCARFGGEEFVVVWYDVTEANARQLCEILNAAVRELQIPHASERPHRILTVSVGACYVENVRLHDWTEIQSEADDNLYLAKDRGRNCVIFTAHTDQPVETHAIA